MKKLNHFLPLALLLRSNFWIWNPYGIKTNDEDIKTRYPLSTSKLIPIRGPCKDDTNFDVLKVQNQSPQYQHAIEKITQELEKL
ncbi:MAG: hypothetical protein ACFFFH_07610 [Candidatus Thorarchaeota archaeon]